MVEATKLWELPKQVNLNNHHHNSNHHLMALKLSIFEP